MKVGIVTLYHDSINYGGILQAYALDRYMNNLGLDAEQIRVERQSISHIDKLREWSKKGLMMSYIKNKTINLMKKPCNYTIKKLRAPYYRGYLQMISSRKENFQNFCHSEIPQSSLVYNLKDVINCINDYDIFITGSDQVWNFAWYNSAFFLDFVPSQKIKVSYAASFSMDSLNEKQKAVVENSLQDFQAISVREESAVGLLDGLTDKQVVHTLDPTLLLEREDWDMLCSELMIEQEYVFCYFLGSNEKARKLAAVFAKERGLTCVVIPHASGGFNLKDIGFGDCQIEAASPQDFLSLIKHASYVFTDSFHAVVFSYIFQKQFYVFNRDSKGTMNTRIKNITGLFGLEARFCNGAEQETMQHINRMDDVIYPIKSDKFESAHEISCEFLKTNIIDLCQ